MSCNVVPVDARAIGILLGPTIRAQTSVFLILVLGLAPNPTPVARANPVASAAPAAATLASAATVAGARAVRRARRVRAGAGAVITTTTTSIAATMAAVVVMVMAAAAAATPAAATTATTVAPVARSPTAAPTSTGRPFRHLGHPSGTTAIRGPCSIIALTLARHY
jgi:hypothetical protein